MGNVKKILAPVDLSKLSMIGVRRALEIAVSSDGAEVIIYHVIPLEETPYPHAAEEWLASHLELSEIRKAIDKRKMMLARFVGETPADMTRKMRMRQEVEIGVPYKKIVEKAIEKEVDMIVMCTHGRTGLFHMLIGSVTEQVVRRAPCAVLSVPPAREAATARSRPA